MFKSCVFYFVGIATKRASIFQTRINGFGGKVSTKRDDSNVTHVVVDEALVGNVSSCNRTLAQECENWGKNVEFVSAKWLCECLKLKKCVPCGEFRVQVVPVGGTANTKKRELEDSEELDVEDVVGTTADATNQKHVDEGSGDVRPVVPSTSTDLTNAQNYLCSQPSPTKKIRLERNEAIVAELQKLADTYRATKDKWRLFSYEKAIAAISKHDKEISTYQEALAIPGVGEKLALKVMEVIEVGSVRKVEEVCNSEMARTLELFCGVWGAGPTTADSWYRAGYRTLAHLHESATLTQQQRVGLRLYDEFNERIPREEVERMGVIVNEAAIEVAPSLSTMTVGSYRRGKATSGDIDVMITNPGPLSPNDVLRRILAILKSKGIVTDDLTLVGESRQQRKWLGVSRISERSPHRRLDLFVVPAAEQAAALLHFTGSALFNRSIRLLAARKGMLLTEHGLYTGTVRKGNEIVHEGHLLETATEEDIFKHLQLEYRPPQERDH